MRFLPNKIQLDILKRHVGPFIFCFFTVMFLLLMQFLILYINRLIGKGLPLGVIIELILTNLAYMVVLAAPMSVLVASLMAFGKFTELNELSALRAAGVNPIHVINPVLIAAALLSVFLIWFSNDVLPDSNQRALSLFIDIRIKKPGFDLKKGEFYHGINGYTFLVKNMTSDSDSLYDVTLFQEPSNEQKRAIIKAKKGYLKSNDNQTLTLYLYNGTVLRYLSRQTRGKPPTEILEKTAFKRHRISFDLSKMAFSHSSPNKYARNDRTMDIEAMKAVIDSIHTKINDERQKVFSNNTFGSSKLLPENSYLKKKLLPQGSLTDKNKNQPYHSQFKVLESIPTRYRQQKMYQTAMANLRDYYSQYQSLQVNQKWRATRIAEFWVEILKKFSLPLACIVFVLIGAPIGMYTKKGNLGTAALISTGFLTFFFISIIQGEKLADRLFISPFTGMWTADIVLGIIGTVLVLQLCTSFQIPKFWNRD